MENFYLKNCKTGEIKCYKIEDFYMQFGGNFEDIITEFCVNFYIEKGIDIPVEKRETIFFMDFVNNWNNSKRNTTNYKAIYYSDLPKNTKNQIEPSIKEETTPILKKEEIIKTSKNNKTTLSKPKEHRNQSTRTAGNGEGTLYYSETLQCLVYQYFVEGDPVRKTMKQRKKESEREFNKRVRDLRYKLEHGTHIKKTKDTFFEILEKHIDQKFKDNITGSATYDRDLATKEQIRKTCKKFINKSIQKVTVEDIEDAKDEIRKYSNNSIDKIWRLLYKTFSIAISRQKIVFNPMDDESLTKPISQIETKSIESLSLKEEEKLIEILRIPDEYKQFKQIALLELYTGMRIGEILALSTDCIDLEKNTITVYRTMTRENGRYVLGKHTKTYNRRKNIDKGKRTFPMTPKTREIILQLMKRKTTNMYKLLFWDYERNVFISTKRVNEYLKKLNRTYNICKQELTSHVLRHTFITRCQEKGIPLVVIQAMVGHIEGSSITNDTYTSVSLNFMNEEISKII